MGTAVTEGARKAEGGNSLVEDKGNISTTADDTARACQSLGEVGGEEAGQGGAGLSEGLAQHPDLQHLAFLEPQHLHRPGGEDAAPPAEGDRTPCHEVTTPMRMASSIVTVLEGCVAIYV
jgi:hypothetical protein